MKTLPPKNKKAQGLNYIAVVIVLVLFGFFSILAYTIWAQILTALAAGGFYVGTVKVTADAFTRGFAAADYMIILLFVFLTLGIGLTSFKLPTRTIGFLITLVVGVFWCFVSYFFNYIFIQLVSPDVLSVAVGLFSRTMILCTNLHWVALIQIIVGSITLFGKEEKGQFLT